VLNHEFKLGRVRVAQWAR